MKATRAIELEASVRALCSGSQHASPLPLLVPSILLPQPHLTGIKPHHQLILLPHPPILQLLLFITPLFYQPHLMGIQPYPEAAEVCLAVVEVLREMAKQLVG